MPITTYVIEVMARRSKQLLLFAAPRARRSRARIGRPPREERKGFVPHVKRPAHQWQHPVHVTMRTVRGVPSLRTERIRNLIVRLIAGLKHRGVRVVHHSIQPDHLHLMVEAHDRKQLSRKMQLLFSRIARAVNRMIGRRGSLFRDRHHRVELTSPTQTRNAIVYILFNDRKHAAQRGALTARALTSIDTCSSAPWFDGWDQRARPPPEALAACRRRNEMSEAPTAEPRTWLARAGWRRGGGAIRLDELPKSARVT